MPSFNTNLEIITTILAHNPRQTLYVQGAPGNGKTSLAVAAFDKMGIPRENQIIFRPSLHDPVDLLGVPHVTKGTTRFAPAEMVHRMAAGQWGLCIDELPQAVVMMQNALAGLMLDRVVGECRLSDGVVMIATGNRTQDKAGANRMVTQLSNRVLTLDQESSTDDWVQWALGANMPMSLIGFIRFRPELLNQFSADRAQNPTERSWEMVGRLPNLSTAHMFIAAKGLVGEGASAEYCAFRAICDTLPSIDAIRMNPTSHGIPTDPAVLYAISGALSEGATVETFDSLMGFIERLPVEFTILTLKDTVAKCPRVVSTRAFVSWAAKNAGVLF
jgi:AFG1-like ATPase